MKLKRLNPYLVVAFAVIVTVIVAYVFFELRSGIRVAITNSGSAPLHSVVLHVTGNSYPLGDIAVGASAKATIRPTDESDLKIEFKDADRKEWKLNAGGSFEAGYWGTIRISIKDGAIVDNDQRVTVGLP